MLSAFQIGIIGLLAGIFSNPLPILGNVFVNITTAALVLAYQQLAELTSFPAIPNLIFIFIVAYYVGVFSIKILAKLPIPLVQQIAMGLGGDN